MLKHVAQSQNIYIANILIHIWKLKNSNLEKPNKYYMYVHAHYINKSCTDNGRIYKFVLKIDPSDG